MATIIVCASAKGGSSKTTSTINLAAATAAMGYSTLLVDMDPQANASMALSMKVKEVDQSICAVLLPKTRGGQRESIEKVIYETNYKNLHIAPAHISLNAGRLVMNDMIGRESVLRKELKKPEIQKRYEFIFIDTAPSVDILLINALASADYVIGCSACEFWSLEGIDMMIEQLNQIKEEINPNVKLLGVLATKNNTTTHAKEVLDTLKERYTILGITRTSTKTNEATKKGVPVVYENPHDRVSMEYKRIAGVLMDLYEKEEL